jgi:hypothetical protein
VVLFIFTYFVALPISPDGRLGQPCAGILEQTMGVRNRVGKGLSYWPARLHKLAEFLGIDSWAPWVLKSLKIRALASNAN